MDCINNSNKDDERLPMLDLHDKFKFFCGKEIECSIQCCSNLNLMLTPYDIFRMKKRLKLSSEDFLMQYTTSPLKEGTAIPVVMLRMTDDEKRTCPFASSEGCKIYEDRPGSCRVYPLGQATTNDEDKASHKEIYFIVREPYCIGFNTDKEWTVREWKKNQGLDIYNEMNHPWMEIILDKILQKQKMLDDNIAKMIFMGSYNLDAFKRFVFESRFLETFDIENEVIESIKKDELELMRFGFMWLKAVISGEKVLKVKDEAIPSDNKGL
ncbi:MAG: YkgJ family cysteine cluster protein [Nitrospinota bacterium]